MQALNIYCINSTSKWSDIIHCFYFCFFSVIYNKKQGKSVKKIDMRKETGNVLEVCVRYRRWSEIREQNPTGISSLIVWEWIYKAGFIQLESAALYIACDSEHVKSFGLCNWAKGGPKSRWSSSAVLIRIKAPNSPYKTNIYILQYVFSSQLLFFALGLGGPM